MVELVLVFIVGPVVRVLSNQLGTIGTLGLAALSWASKVVAKAGTLRCESCKYATSLRQTLLFGPALVRHACVHVVSEYVAWLNVSASASPRTM